eukprot:297128-Rhodomonas_salina.1
MPAADTQATSSIRVRVRRVTCHRDCHGATQARRQPGTRGPLMSDSETPAAGPGAQAPSPSQAQASTNTQTRSLSSTAALTRTRSGQP